MDKKFRKLTIEDIVLSILKYKKGDEKNTSTNYFRLGSQEFPVRRIVKEAMIINGSFQDEDYNNLPSCKKILEERLNLSSNHFFKKVKIEEW